MTVLEAVSAEATPLGPPATTCTRPAFDYFFLPYIYA
jgi:hypothetical protein